MTVTKQVMASAQDPIGELYEIFGGRRYAPPIVHQSVEILGPSFCKGGKVRPEEVLSAMSGAFENYDDPWELMASAMVAVRMLNSTVQAEVELRQRLDALVEQVLRQIEFKLT